MGTANGAALNVTGCACNRLNGTCPLAANDLTFGFQFQNRRQKGSGCVRFAIRFVPGATADERFQTSEKILRGGERTSGRSALLVLFFMRETGNLRYICFG